MTQIVSFPGLGFSFTISPDAFSIGGLTIKWYGIIFACAFLLGTLYVLKNTKKFGLDADRVMDVLLGAIIFGVIGARIYYVIFSWDMYKDDLLSIFNIRQGGLAIYGGVIAAIITVCIFAKKRKMSAPLIMDTAGLGLVAGQMIGRWGNFFNREAFGEYTDGLLAMRLPLDAVRSSDVTELMRKHMETVDGVSYIQVHPTFLYESLWCLMVLVVMLLYRKYKKFDGEVFLLYLFGYGVGRFWIEGLRTDQLLIPGWGFPVSQALAGVLVIGSLLLIFYNRRKKKS